MKRVASIILAALLAFSTAANATVRNIFAGADKLQAKVNAANATGDTIICRTGTYTFTSFAALMLSGAGPTNPILSLTIRGAGCDSTTFDVSASGGNDFIYGGDAQRVTWANITFTGTPQNDFLRDAANSVYKNWTFQNCRFANTTKMPIKLTTGNWPGTGTGMSFISCATTSTFNAQSFIHIEGNGTTFYDLLIDGLNLSQHAGNIALAGVAATTAMVDGIFLQNVSDFRIRRCNIGKCSNNEIKIDVTNDSTKTIQQGYISENFLHNGDAPAIHVGSTTDGQRGKTRRIYIENNRIQDMHNGYGAEFENGPADCGMTGNYIGRVQRYGATLAEDTQNIVVDGNFIENVYDTSLTVPGAVYSAAIASSGIITSIGRRHKITNNLVRNCVRGITFQYQSGFFLSHAAAKTITGVTNPAPPSVMVVTSNSHGYSNGDKIRILGVAGQTAANGEWIIGNVAANTFELTTNTYTNSPGYGSGAYTSGGSAYKETDNAKMERTVFRDNQMYNLSYAYRVNALAMPTDYACHMLGTNTIATPATAWADVDGSTLTQAQFEAQFPASFRKPDVNGTRPVNWRLTNGSVGALGQWFGAGGVFLINTGD